MNTYSIQYFCSNTNNDDKWKDIYYVSRIDDNGHKFKIESFKTHDEAHKHLKWMERTKHKQTYIIETIRSSDKKPPN